MVSLYHGFTGPSDSEAQFLALEVQAPARAHLRKTKLYSLCSIKAIFKLYIDSCLEWLLQQMWDWRWLVENTADRKSSWSNSTATKAKLV